MPKIKELRSKGEGRRPCIIDSDGKTWGVPAGKVNGWLASHPDDTAEDLAEFFREEIESPAECKMSFHCFRKEPPRLAVSVATEGVEIPANWWEQ